MSAKLIEFGQSLEQLGCLVFCDISLAPFTAFAAGGNAQLLLLPRNREELFVMLKCSERQNIPLHILGGGANILVADEGVKGVVLSLRYLKGIEWQSGRLRAEAGWDMSEICRYSAKQNAAGLHYFYGMPGSLGGAVYMNARCYEGEMAEIVQRVLCIPPALHNLPLNHSALNERGNVYRCSDLHWVELGPSDWNYKYSHFQQKSGHKLAGALIVAVEFGLREQPQASLECEMQNFLEDRIVKGHFRLPCAGSFFKNNRNFGAPTGKIIDGLGLKGRRCGKAQLAPWHGNIIVNCNQARASEIWQLACAICTEVYRRTGFTLEAEVQRLGEWQYESYEIC